jgi:hypothetical protein
VLSTPFNAVSPDVKGGHVDDRAGIDNRPPDVARNPSQIKASTTNLLTEDISPQLIIQLIIHQ